MNATIVGAVVVVHAAAAALVVWARRRERTRTLGMEEAARALGWSYEAGPPLEAVSGPERHPLFAHGRSRAVRNLMAGERDGLRAAIFDYHYVVGAGQTAHHSRQTVVYLRSAGLELPVFSLRPEQVIHRVGGVFGHRDIDFPGRTEFSRRCLLRGPDEAAVRAAFAEEVTGFFEAEAGWCADAGGEGLLLWRAGKRLDPGEVPGLLASGIDLLDRLRTRGGVAAGSSGAS